MKSWDIRDAVGLMIDGCEVESCCLPFVRAAVSGTCMTEDKGEQQFVVNMNAVLLHNVDGEELIWPSNPDECADSEIPLRVIVDPELWKQFEEEWEPEAPAEWTAFVWRIAVPLVSQLGLVGSWDKIIYPPLNE